MKIFVIILIVSSSYGWGNISDTINKISDLNLLYNIATSEKENIGLGVGPRLGTKLMSGICGKSSEAVANLR